MKRVRGFTLIEIMIVLAIITIGTMIATVNLQSWFGHYSAVDFQREFYSKNSQARTLSLASNLQHRLLVDIDNESVTLQRGNSGTGSTTWVNVGQQLSGTSGAGISDITYTPGPTTVNSGSFAFVFNPGGQVLTQSNPASMATISPLTQADVRLSSEKVADRTTVRIFGWTSNARLTNGW